MSFSVSPMFIPKVSRFVDNMSNEESFTFLKGIFAAMSQRKAGAAYLKSLIDSGKE